MTTMSMTGTLSDGAAFWLRSATQPIKAARPVPRNVIAEATVWDACVEYALEVSGGMALALIPFASLARMFVAW